MDKLVGNQRKIFIYIYKNRFYLDLDDEYIKICEYVDDIIYKDNKLINNN